MRKDFTTVENDHSVNHLIEPSALTPLLCQ